MSRANVLSSEDFDTHGSLGFDQKASPQCSASH